MFSITSTIEIDAAHRVPTHGSKCFNLHGHRYKIQATAVADELGSGEETAMVMDFSFLKKAMMDVIDCACDHGTIVWHKDHLLCYMLNGHTATSIVEMQKKVASNGSCLSMGSVHSGHMKVLMVDFIPTAELLAKFWFQELQDVVNDLHGGRVTLKHLEVWETPNNKATYPAE